MVRLLLIALPLAAVLGGCKTQSDLYCGAHPDVCTTGGPTDGSNGSNDNSCHGPSDCTSADKSVCDTSNGMCVVCTTSDTHACPGEVCKNDACQPCTKHADCASHACLADGTCAKAADVAYVSAGGTGTTCTDNTTSACATINQALATNKSIIKVVGAITDDMPTVIDGKAVQMLGDGASLQRTTSGVTLDVKNTGADVRIYNVNVINGTSAKSDPAVSLSGSGTPKLSLTQVKIDGNAGIGITSTAGLLTISRSTISNNTGGGIFVSGGDFDITNSFITTNGAPGNDPAAGMPSFGGVLVNSTSPGTRRFQFNTVAGNSCKVTSGVLCGPNVPTVTFSNDIVFGNQGTGAPTQIGGLTCAWTFSDIGETLTPPGNGNGNGDPLFVDPNTDNYHLMSGSPAKDMADVNATLSIDFDGDTRPQGARSDMGADEFKQPP